jgi:3-phosphoshikimate 1-carboxyvinyltransferase
MKLISKSAEGLHGEIKIPGDKSISHRALICASISDGTSKISNLQESEDVINTLKSLEQLGVKIVKENESYFIEGKGFKGLKASENQLYFGNSGTGIRLMSGILSIQNFSSSLIGDESLSKRPMKRIIDPLSKMGANISGSKEDTPPLFITPSKKINGINYKMPVASAQVKSAILFASLGAQGDTKIIEKSISRDHTERMFEYFGASISFSETETTLKETEKFTSQNIEIPGDFSSSAFFIVAALISKNSDITLKEVGMNPSRIALLNKLMEMGGNIQVFNHSSFGKEPVADLNIKSSVLNPCEVTSGDVPNLIDELPILFIASCFAEGISSFIEIEELKHKESNRLKAMQDGLDKMKIKNYLDGNVFCIEGMGKDYKSPNFLAETYYDHRIAMSFAIAGLNSNSYIEIASPECINTSFPEFIELGKKLGCNFEIS